MTQQQHPHAWVPSTLGHGNKMCSRCKLTDLEAAALDETDYCTVAPAVVAWNTLPRKRSV